MKVKMLLLILRGIGIRSNTNATICGERVGSEYVVARGRCVASADLCGEQEKREGIAGGDDGSGIGFQVDPSPRDVLDCHLLPLKVMVKFKLYDAPALLCLCRRLGLQPNFPFPKCLTGSLSSTRVKSTSSHSTLHNHQPPSNSPFTRHVASLLIARRSWSKAGF